jgi:uncharacterized membrane protein YkoI
MKINKTIVIAIVLFGLLISGLGTGVLLTQRPLSVNAAPPAQEDNDTDEAGDVEDNGGDEAGEPEEAVSPDQGSITADEAKAAAEATYSGAKAVAVEVKLDNGLEVIVDAGNGDILGTE